MTDRGMIPLLDDMSFLPMPPLAGDLYASRRQGQGHRDNTLEYGEPIAAFPERDEGDFRLLVRLWEVWPRGPADHVMDWRVRLP